MREVDTTDYDLNSTEPGKLHIYYTSHNVTHDSGVSFPSCRPSYLYWYVSQREITTSFTVIMIVVTTCRNATSSHSQVLAKYVSYTNDIFGCVLVPWMYSTSSSWKAISERFWKLCTSCYVCTYYSFCSPSWPVWWGMLVLSLMEMADWFCSIVSRLVQLLFSTERLAICWTTCHHANTCLFQFLQAYLPTDPIDSHIWFSSVHASRSRSKWKPYNTVRTWLMSIYTCRMETHPLSCGLLALLLLQSGTFLCRLLENWTQWQCTEMYHFFIPFWHIFSWCCLL